MSGLAEFGRCTMSMIAHECECMAQEYGSAGQNLKFSTYTGDLCGDNAEREEVSGTVSFRAEISFASYHQLLLESGPLARKCSQTKR